MILALLAALLVSAADSLPRLTLAEALTQGVRLDPEYVRAFGNIGSAEWSRRAALITFVVPSQLKPQTCSHSILRVTTWPA